MVVTLTHGLGVKRLHVDVELTDGTKNRRSFSSVAAGAMEVDTVASRFYSVIMIVQNDARIQSPNLSDCSVSEAYPTTTTTEYSTTATFTTDGKLDDSYTET